MIHPINHIHRSIHPIYRHQSHQVSNPSLFVIGGIAGSSGFRQVPMLYFFFFSIRCSIGVHSYSFPPPTTLPAFLLFFFSHTNTAHRRFLNADSGLCSGFNRLWVAQCKMTGFGKSERRRTHDQGFFDLNIINLSLPLFSLCPRYRITLWHPYPNPPPHLSWNDSIVLSLFLPKSLFHTLSWTCTWLYASLVWYLLALFNTVPITCTWRSHISIPYFRIQSFD